MDPLTGPAVARICHMMIETMPVPAIAYDTEQIVYANPSLAHLLKARHSKEVVGRSVLDFVHPDARPAVMERTRIIIESGARIPHVENRLILCDGGELRVTLCAFPLRFGDARLVCAFIQSWGESVPR